MSRNRRGAIALALLATAALLAACATDDATEDANDDGGGAAPVELVLITHDSFALTPSVLEDFTARTGIEVSLLPSGDAGTAVSRAVLTAEDPEGDVLFGVDGALLSRALDADLFLPYESPSLDAVPDAYEVDEHVTPIDVGQVCVNYDRAWFDDAELDPPRSFADLADPAYRGLLVVEDPASSSPGLAFLFASWSALGPDGWESWWSALRDNDVEVAAGWEAAYYGSFSGGSGSGTRPLVVSYASSPVAEVVFAEEPPAEAPTGVVTATCIEQVEYAGVLRGTEHEEAARQLVDFLLSEEVQADIPLQMFVAPAREGVALPAVWTEHAVEVAEPIRVDPATLDAERDPLITRWTEIVLR